MNNTFYVYALLDLRRPGKFSYRDSRPFDHEPIYVGKGKENRINEHDGEIHSKSRTRKANKIRKIFKETGLLPLKIKLYENLTEEQAFETEIFVIKQIGRLDHQRGPLTNATDGGDGPSGWIPSEETRRKLSKALSGRIFTEETRKKFSDVNSGEKNPNYRKKTLEETRKKISIANSNPSEETRRKKSTAKSGEKNPNFGKSPSKETRRKQSETLSGKKHSEETKQKMRKSRENRKQRSGKLNISVQTGVDKGKD